MTTPHSSNQARTAERAVHTTSAKQAARDAEAAPRARRDRAATAPGPIRVLCVDDHAMLIEGLRAQFESGTDIEMVGSMATATRLEEEVVRLKPDVVILDIEMPGADAFEMSDRVLRSNPELKIIVLSAHIRDAFISACFASGIRGYFAKSDQLEDIVGGVYEVSKSGPGSFILGPKVRACCRPVASPASSRRSAAAGGAPGSLIDSLTPREAEILRLIGKGLSRVRIGEQLNRSPRTIDGHQERILRKLGIATRADLIRFAIREGLAQA